MFTKTMNFPMNHLALVSLCTKKLKTFLAGIECADHTHFSGVIMSIRSFFLFVQKNLTFKTWNWFLIKNGRSRPKTTSETHNDEIGFYC